ncbi:MAG: aminotransferase class III-fold pyridoxal phosphate-dependent enzyme [Actinomycetota bacterium]|nr:aminotransferase class III-fold pyridoxal phosphate-dependent enzyme [Actinomycetota bacterium]
MEFQFDRSAAQYERSRRSLARGVATAFRASQRPVPICFERGDGSRLYDIDGNEYVDYVLGFGPMLLGHSPESVIRAIEAQVRTGIGYGASHPLEAELAEAICRVVPSAEMCIFGSTGSEAVHAAIRIARAVTGRTRVVKFLGHYHGWLDSIHVGVSPQATPGPGTAGQDPHASESMTVTRWNDLDALRGVLDDDVAVVIMEPVNVNGGTIVAEPGYLEAAAELARAHGALVVFDEVITGFRLALGGAQERYSVVADLTVLGKAFGSGMPISAVCGRSEILSVVAEGRVAHVGTFNGGPVCAAAALATIRELEAGGPELYARLDAAGEQIAGALSKSAGDRGVPVAVNRVGGVLSMFVADTPPATYEATLDTRREDVSAIVTALLQCGVHIVPDGRWYVSTAHSGADLAQTCDRIDRAIELAVEERPDLARR